MPRRGIFALSLASAFLLFDLATAARPGLAQGLRPGEAFITRFSGVAAQPGGGNAGLAIDPQGVVGSIIDLRAPGQPPEGRHWINEPQRQPVRAEETGQIFGVALDDASPPNIYVTATSAFGLHRTPDNRAWMPGMWGPGGPGAIYRLDAANGYRPTLFARIAPNGRPNTGAALGNIAYDRVNKQFYVSDMETGLIHRVGLDGSDRGIFDHGAQGRAGFMDVESGKRASLPPIAFPPQTRAQIEDCQPLVEGARFDQSPECWNFVPAGRRVWGLGVAQLGPDQVRLFYAVASGPAFGEAAWSELSDEEKRNSVWSVRIGPDGGFDEGDVRREFILPDFFIDEQDVAASGFSHPVSDIAFPSCGTDRPVMLVAERGGIRNLGLEADFPFATPGQSRTIRYELDGRGVWQPVGRYDIGFYDRQRDGPPYIRANCAGGAAFGPGYSEGTWRANPGQPDQFVWITGDLLCSPDGPCNGASPSARAGGPPSPQPTAAGEDAQQGDTSEVHGIQGMPAGAFDELLPGQGFGEPGQQGEAAPEQGPPPPVGPSQAYLIDADVNVDPSGAPIEEELLRNDATMVGDIAIFQECAPAQPVYMVPPPVAPVTAWPAYGRVHAERLSHARVASHGRRLSHFRFGSHLLAFSHNRWASHAPRISHNRRRSHYRWYSDWHIRPLSPGHSRRLSPTHRRPLSPGHNRRLSPGHSRPLSPTHNRYTSPVHRRPLSPGHSRTASPGHRRPLSPGHVRAISQHSRATSPGHSRQLSRRPRPVPIGRPKQPVIAPAVRPGRPGVRPIRPGVRPGRPSARPVRPSTRPRRPTARPGRPAVRPKRPSVRPGRPSIRPGRPGTRPARPAIRSGRPGARSGRPAARPSRPSIRPGGPSARPGGRSGPRRGGRPGPDRSRRF